MSQYFNLGNERKSMESSDAERNLLDYTSGEDILEHHQNSDESDYNNDLCSDDLDSRSEEFSLSKKNFFINIFVLTYTTTFCIEFSRGVFIPSNWGDSLYLLFFILS
jgi:hypothetical protein